MNTHGPNSQFERERPLPAPLTGPAFSSALEIRRVWAAFRRRIRLFAAIAIVVLLAVVLKAALTTPIYTATSQVMLDVRRQKVAKADEVLSGLPADNNVVDSEVEVLRSRAIADRVATSLRLDEDPLFNGQKPKSSLLGRLRALTNAPANSVLSRVDPVKQHEATIDALLRGVSVRRVGLTYVTDVSFSSTDPAKAAQIANRWAETYLSDQVREKLDATQEASVALDDRLGQLRSQALADDAAVQQYRIANNLLSTSGATLTEQEISNFNQSLALAKAQVAEDEARLNTATAQLARGSTGEDVGEALSSPVIQNLRQQRVLISARVADLQGRYGNLHPELLKARRELQDIDAQISAEIQRIVSNLQARLQVSRQRAQAIAGSLGGAQGTLAANNKATVRLNELQRAADASRTLYESYLNRFKETNAQQGLGQADARIVSTARVPLSPSSPKMILSVLAGAFLALMAGGGSVAAAELLDVGLRTEDDVERRLQIPFLGSIPLLRTVAEDTRLAPADYVINKPLSNFSEAFRALRTAILHSKLGGGVQVVAITSALPTEGKTTTAICLGHAAALQGTRTIVVDCDLRRKSVNQAYGEQTAIGLLQVLSQDARLDAAIRRHPTSGLATLPLAIDHFTPRDVLGSEAMGRLLDQLRSEFELVILDTAPVLPVADTRVLAPRADATVMVAQWRRTPEPAVQRGLHLLESVGANVVGVVLTRVDAAAARREAGGPGKFYDRYKDYYYN